jgi:phosphatidylinositol glycan class M
MSTGLTFCAAWVASEVSWLLCAYFVEFEGQSVYAQVWAASLVFLGVNVFILTRLIQRWNACNPGHDASTPSASLETKKDK